MSVALAKLEGRTENIASLLRPPDIAVRKDPGSHGFAKALLAYPSKPGGEHFDEGLIALRRALKPTGDDPSVQNKPNWPHNREGFLLFAADYESRAGHAEEAARLLDRIEAEPTFANWPFRAAIAERRTRWANAAATSGPKTWMRGKSCVVCHRR